MLFCCLWGISSVHAESNPDDTEQDCADCFKENDVKALRQAFKDGAEVYYGKLLDGKEEQVAHVMNSADMYLDYFASQDYSDKPAWELRALTVYTHGELDEALDLYAEQNLVEKYTPGSDLYGSIERNVMLLQLSGVRDQAREGLEMLDRVARIDSTSLVPMLLLINVALDLQMQSVADGYLDMFQRRADDEMKQAMVLYARAMVAFRRSRPNEALGYAQSAAALFDKHSSEQPKGYHYVNYRGQNLYSLARIYNRMGQDERCVNALRQCRDCYANDDSDSKYLLERIQTLNGMAPLAADNGAFFLADSIYQEVDELGNWLFDGNKFQQSSFVFDSRRLRGLVAYRVGKFEEAEMYFSQASAVLDELEQMAPGQNVEKFENLYFNQASLYYAQDRIEEALAMNRKVLNLVQHCAMHDEEHRKLNLAYCHKYIGNCLWALAYQKYLDANKKRVKEVTKYYQEASNNYKTALQYNPRDVEAASKYNLGELVLAGMEKPMAMPKSFDPK